MNATQLVAGDRVIVVGFARVRNESSATVLAVASCRELPGSGVRVSLDGGGRNGMGVIMCVPSGALRPGRPLSLQQLIEDSGHRTVGRQRGGDRRKVRGPAATTGTTAANDDDNGDLYLGHRREGSMRAPVLPSLFLPGFPKSATTWLYNCLLAAFTPFHAGCGSDSARWNTSACPRRFLLSPLTAGRWLRGVLQVNHVKEPFYFGGSRKDRFRKDLLTLHGPDAALATPPGESDLWAGLPTTDLLTREPTSESDLWAGLLTD